MTNLLTAPEVKAQLRAPGWRRVGGRTPRIQGRYAFKDFKEALRFVVRAGKLAEAQGHHPNITILYNRVTLNLWTHDSGGITPKDLRLAEAIAALAAGKGTRK